jgi:hypothetical protein
MAMEKRSRRTRVTISSKTRPKPRLSVHECYTLRPSATRPPQLWPFHAAFPHSDMVSQIHTPQAESGRADAQWSIGARDNHHARRSTATRTLATFSSRSAEIGKMSGGVA